MKHIPYHLGTIVALAALTACTVQAPDPTATSAGQSTPAAAAGSPLPQAHTALGRMAAEGIAKAREKLAKENINLNGGIERNGHRNVVNLGKKEPDDTRPDAELTPGGDLLIDGKRVAATPEQHALLLRYRQAIVGVAEAGMAIGVQGADLGGEAIGEVFSGLLSGHPDEIDRKIKAKASGIEAQAQLLCAQLKPLQALQQELATKLPAFAPYATMKPGDVDDCGKHEGSSDGTTTGDAERARIRREVQGSIRDAVRTAVRIPSDTTGPAAPPPAQPVNPTR